jgi:tRNA (guanine-N7-)-methyltransferase
LWFNKKKHHKRRIVQQDFLNLLAKKLKIGSVCHMATDWQDYAQQMTIS